MAEVPTGRKSESRLAEATEKTTAALQELRTRLAKETTDRPREENPDDLERQLEAYFSNSSRTLSPALSEIRQRVIEAVADRIFQAWEDPRGASIKKEIVDRLIERVLEDLGK